MHLAGISLCIEKKLMKNHILSWSARLLNVGRQFELLSRRVYSRPSRRLTLLCKCAYSCWSGNSTRSLSVVWRGVVASCSRLGKDDQQVLRWTADGDFIEQAIDFPFSTSRPRKADGDKRDVPAYCVTDARWLPTRGSEVIAIAATDGKFYLCGKTGRVEKAQEAHKGAVLCICWSSDGTALATGGEDGQVKVWSRTGMLRSVLHSTGLPVYSLVWSPDSNHILLSYGKNIVLKPLQPNQKITSWKAHEGSVLKVNWNVINNLIITCGEDRKYKVWDQYGRQLFSSKIMDYPIVSLCWNPTGDMFAVGGYNSLRLCDKLGWCYAHTWASCGNMVSLSWSTDGTQLACAGGNGTVLFAHLVDRRYEWKHLEITVTDEKTIIVNDISTGMTETLEFREKIVKVSINFGHLIVGTSTQLYIHNERTFNTPSIIDLPQYSRVLALVQAKEYFLLIDSVKGIQIYSYDGKFVSSPKYSGLKPETLNDRCVALSADTLIIRDSKDEKCILLYVFDVLSGKLFGDEPLRHTSEIIDISLEQSSTFMTRLLALIDKNHDLYLTPVVRPQFRKLVSPLRYTHSYITELANMTDSIRFHDDCPMLSSIVDGKLIIWYYPSAVLIDQDILHLTKHERTGSQWSNSATIQAFFGLQCTVRSESGVMITAGNISPYPMVLLELVSKKKWEDAIRLCRTAKSKDLWACLATMSVNGNDLNTAEVAYAAIDEASKVQFICYVKVLNGQDARNAELAVFRHQFKEAENILLSAGQVYRVIRMWVLLHNWERALDIAVKFKNFVDVVLYHRQRYLEQIGFRESSKKFLAVSLSVAIDEAKIKSLIAEEDGKLMNRGTRV